MSFAASSCCDLAVDFQNLSECGLWNDIASEADNDFQYKKNFERTVRYENVIFELLLTYEEIEFMGVTVAFNWL